MNLAQTISLSIQGILLISSLLLFIYAIWIMITQNPFHNKETQTQENVNIFSRSQHNAQHPIEYNIHGINDYHQQVLMQSRFSFWFSLIIATLGFLIIALSLFKLDNIEYIGIVSGSILEAVAGLFFYQSNRVRASMMSFFDKLRSDNKINDALELCNSIEDKEMKNQLKVKLALHFVGMNPSLGDQIIESRSA